jgi:precorrin-2 dehydrogenase/sirohydrochlorin ferrochelatase
MMTRAARRRPRFLPVGIDFTDALCVVIGGGAVGTRKALSLLRAGARVRVVAPVVTKRLAREFHAGHMEWTEASFRETQLKGAFLVVAATDDLGLNATVVRRARRAGTLVCDASSAERSQVIFGALLDHAKVTVAVFTDGRQPSTARRVRDRIKELLESDRNQERH